MAKNAPCLCQCFMFMLSCTCSDYPPRSSDYYRREGKCLFGVWKLAFFKNSWFASGEHIFYCCVNVLLLKFFNLENDSVRIKLPGFQLLS